MTPLTGNSAELGISSSGRIENLKLNATGRVRLALQQQRATGERRESSPRSRLYAEQQLIRLAHTPRQERHFRARAAVRGSTSAEKWAARTSVTSSSASFRGAGYNIGGATLGSSSSSRITVGVVQDLKATASSSSAIYYKGDPKTRQVSTSSSAKIRKEE